jgi:hypothetical protein
MKVGHFELRFGPTSWEIWEDRTLKYKRDTYDEALELADDLLEEDRQREEIAQWGSDGIGSNEADDRWKMRREPA